jgi:hypothetical protein
MSRMKVVLGGALLLLIAGCASTYTRQTITASQLKLASTGSVLVAVPQNGAYGDESYPASGSETAGAVRSAFARFSDNVQLATVG